MPRHLGVSLLGRMPESASCPPDFSFRSKGLESRRRKRPLFFPPLYVARKTRNNAMEIPEDRPVFPLRLFFHLSSLFSLPSHFLFLLGRYRAKKETIRRRERKGPRTVVSVSTWQHAGDWWWTDETSCHVNAIWNTVLEKNWKFVTCMI